MKDKNSDLLTSIYEMFGEIKSLEVEMAFIHLLNNPELLKKSNEIQVLQALIIRNLQYGNYRSVIRYFVALKKLVKEFKIYDGEVKSIITTSLLENR